MPPLYYVAVDIAATCYARHQIYDTITLPVMIARDITFTRCYADMCSCHVVISAGYDVTLRHNTILISDAIVAATLRH